MPRLIIRTPGVLRSLVEIIAEQAVYQRRSTDQLWNDEFIDLCRDWAVPYIADLLATRLVSSQNRRGRRVDVAKTIYYRRRAGTVRVLEDLISDITGWEGVVVEQFRRLARFHHLFDPSTRDERDVSRTLLLAATPTCAASAALNSPARRLTSTFTCSMPASIAGATACTPCRKSRSTCIG